MKTFIRELVRGGGVFFPIVVFCLAMCLQFMRWTPQKPIVTKEVNAIVTEKEDNMLCLSKKEDQTLYLLFEQFTR